MFAADLRGVMKLFPPQGHTGGEVSGLAKKRASIEEKAICSYEVAEQSCTWVCTVTQCLTVIAYTPH